MSKVAVQAPRYVSTAGLSAASDWAAFVGLAALGAGAVEAQAVSRLVGGLVAFVLHRVWTYDATQHRVGTQVFRFLALYVASYALSLATLHGLVEIAGAPAAPSKLGADALCFAFNFVAMKAWVFSGDPEPGGAEPELPEQAR